MRGQRWTHMPRRPGRRRPDRVPGVSTLAVWLFVLVAIALVAAVVAVVLVARSVYRRSRVLAQNLTGLAVDLERTMNTVGHPDGTVRQPKP